MMKMMGITCGAAIALLSVVALPGSAEAQTAEDRAAVQRAALGYIEAFYEGDASKVHAYVHPEMLKFGFWRGDDGSYERSPMSWDEMLGFVRRVHETEDFPADDAPKRAEILDLMEQIAVAKVDAWWGSDYLTMAKYDGEWKIVQILWEGPPRM